MIIIAGTADFAEQSHRDAAVAAGAPFVKATREEEPGCLAYVFSADSVDPRRIDIYELWEDAETLDAHFQHENYWKMREVFGPYREHGFKTNVKKYRTDAVDPVYGEDRIATSRFWSAE